MSKPRDDTAHAGHGDNATMEREYEQLLLAVLNDISDAMKRNDISRADLARRLGSSRAHVTQTLSGSRKLTLKLVFNMAWACGLRMNVKIQPLKTRS
jgi:antitoxin component HigA of HigAB toxin-antitoxin module